MDKKQRIEMARRSADGAAGTPPHLPPHGMGAYNYYNAYHEAARLGGGMPQGPGPGSHPQGPPPPMPPHHPGAPPDYAAKQYQDYMASYASQQESSYAAWTQAMSGYYGAPPYSGYPPGPYGPYGPPPGPGHPPDAPPGYYPPPSEPAEPRRRPRDSPSRRADSTEPPHKDAQPSKSQQSHPKSSSKRGKDKSDLRHRVVSSDRGVVSPFQRNAVFKQNGMLDTERQASGKSSLGVNNKASGDGPEKKNGSAGSSESGPVVAPGDRADSSRSTRTAQPGPRPKQNLNKTNKTRGSSGSSGSGQATYQCMHPTRTKDRLGEAMFNSLRSLIMQQQEQYQAQVAELFRICHVQLALTEGKEKAVEMSKEIPAAGAPASTSGRVSPPSDDPDEVSNSKPNDKEARAAIRKADAADADAPAGSGSGPRLWSKSFGYISRALQTDEAAKDFRAASRLQDREREVAPEDQRPAVTRSDGHQPSRAPEGSKHHRNPSHLSRQSEVSKPPDMKRTEEIPRLSRLSADEKDRARHSSRPGGSRRRRDDEPSRPDQQPPAKRPAVMSDRDGQPSRVAQSPSAHPPQAMGPPYDPQHAAAMAAYHHHQQQQQQMMHHHMAMSGRMPPPPGAPYPPPGTVDPYNPEYAAAMNPAWSAYYANAAQYAAQHRYGPPP